MKSNLAVKNEGQVCPQIDLSDVFIEPSACGKGEDLDRFSDCLENPPTSGWIGSHLRRALDIVVAAAVLIACSIPMLVIALLVCATSRGGALFTQERVGRGGRLFKIYKFRSMTVDRGKNAGIGLTKAGDVRVTPVGKILRRFKLDEIPQFWNVLRGDMSLVGPRPKLPQYEGIPNMPYRPGITGPATLAFREEEELLRDLTTEEIELVYEQQIKLLKARIDVCYMCQANPISDMGMLTATMRRCKPGECPARIRESIPVPAEQTD